MEKCPNCNSYIKREGNSLHVWDTEFECGFHICGSISDKNGNFEVVSSCKKDKVTVINAGNITVASGYKCEKCGLIRSFDSPNCFCKK